MAAASQTLEDSITQSFSVICQAIWTVNNNNLVSHILRTETNKEVLLKIFQKNPDVFNKPFGHYKKPVIHYAVENGHTIMTEFLVKTGVDVNSLCSEGQTALHTAGHSKIRLQNNLLKQANLTSCVQLLTQTNKADFNRLDKNGRSPLHIALWRNDDLALTLIAAGADVDASSMPYRATRPIHEAVSRYNFEGVRLLIEHGASVNVKTTFGDNPLFYALFIYDVKCNTFRASQSKKLQVIDKTIKMIHFLFSNKCSHLALNNISFSALSKIVQFDSESSTKLTSAVLRIFLQNGNCNKQDELGFCPIHYCILLCRHLTLRKLLDVGCDINAKDSMGRTCLHLISWCFNKPYRNSTDGLYEERLQTWLQLLDKLLKNGACVNVKDCFGRLPLHYAVEFSCTQFAENFILEKEDSVNDKDSVGLTPLHIASSKNNTALMNLLISHGAEINVLDNQGSSPMHHACFAKAADAVSLLMKHHSDPFLKDVCGQTPIDVARNRYSTESIKAIYCYVRSDAEISADIRQAVVVERDVSDTGNGESLLGCETEIKPDEVTTEQHSMNENSIEQQQKQQVIKNPQQAEAILAKLQDMPGVGLVSSDMPEVLEISSAVTSLVEELVTDMGKIDSRFKGTVIPSGSYFEGTKVGDPDEFDFMVNLTYFTDLKLKLANHSDLSFLDLEEQNSSIREFLGEHLDSGKHYLLGARIVQHFVILLGKAISHTVKKVHPNLAVKLFGAPTAKIISPSSYSKTSAAVECIWNGRVYKSLNISIDVVPCIYFTDWPEDAKNSGLLTPDMISLGYHWLPNASRISFSMAERAILQSLPEKVFKSYIYCKMLRNQCICPKLKHVRNDENKEIVFCDAFDVIPSIILKTFLFQVAEEYMDQLEDVSIVDIINEVYSKLARYVEDEPVVSYFVPEDVLFEEGDTYMDYDLKLKTVLGCIEDYLTTASLDTGHR